MTLNFKVSDREKFDAIWTLLNSNYNEENGWVIDYAIVDIYDEYAIVYNYENNSYAQVTYTKSDEDNTVALGEFKTVYAMFVTESEKNALEALRTLNGDSFELVNEKFSAAIEAELAANNSVEEANAKIEEYSTKISELENNLTTLNTEKETVEGNFTAANEKISALEEEVTSLKDYKAAVEKEKKLAIINTYSSVLSDEVIEDFTNRIDEYVDEISLDKDMAYALKKSNFSIFN
jgi:chromosome segregation ATPase